MFILPNHERFAQEMSKILETRGAAPPCAPGPVCLRQHPLSPKSINAS